MNKYSRFTSKSFKLAVAAVAICGAGSAMAANNATATATSTVINPIAIVKATDLAFGSISAGATGGTVTIATDGARTKTGDVFLASGAASAAAKFNVTGSGTLTYSITLGGDTSLSDGTNTMPFARVSDLTGGGTTSGNVSAGALTGGAQSIYVGGILTVAANQAAGSYTGNITATVDYN
jgi:spore coat protein U-like protein